MKKLTAIISLLLTITTLTSCTPLPDAPEESPPWRIAIITNCLESGDEENYRAAQALVARFGDDRVMHRTSALSFGWIDWSPIIEEIAQDSEIQAIIISTSGFFMGPTAPAIDELLATRDDIFAVYTGPSLYPMLSSSDIAQRSNLIIQTNSNIGEIYVMQAISMGAQTIAHYSFPRHLYIPFIAERRNSMKAAAEREGIRFVELTSLDPMEVSTSAYAVAFIEQDLPTRVEEFGVNTAFFGTSCVMQSAIISGVMATGAIFVQTCCPSPYHGYPAAFGVDYRVYTGEYADWRTSMMRLIDLPELVGTIDDAVYSAGMTGRISGWAIPADMMWTTIGFMYAIEWINGNVPQEPGVICLDTLERMAREYTAKLGFDSGATLSLFTFYGDDFSHFVLGTVDYHIFGGND